MAEIMLAIDGGTSAHWQFSSDNNWSSFTMKAVNFTLDESVSGWGYTDVLSFNVVIGGHNVTTSPIQVSRQYGDSGSEIIFNFMDYFGQDITGISPGSSIRVYFVRNDPQIIMTHASITYEGIEKSYKWLMCGGNKIYKEDDVRFVKATVTSTTAGQYYVTAEDYIWKILGHMDWSITSDYVEVALPEYYRSTITDYYTRNGTIYPLYIYS